ncbi:hypothetical protein [Microcystis aeruginosa]|uniref:hypothetical protein n=1 Tax=Microcystis aeruginosa TaxID=1126 RepID=UPI00139687F5|nr:hypothetical protein [Microcystis aeruginosa]
MSLKSRLKGWHCSKGVKAIASKTLLAWFCISEWFVGTEGRLSVVELIMPQKKMLYISLTHPTGVLLGSAFGIAPNLTASINVHGAFPKILH